MKSESGVTNSNSPELSEGSEKRLSPQKPRELFGFVCDLGGNAVRFFQGIFFWRLSLFILRFFKVLSVLVFFFGGFFATNFGMGVRGFCGGFLGPKTPFLRPENGERKVLPFLALFFGVVLLLRIVSGRVLGHELRVLYWRYFCLVEGVRFCMD